MKKSSWLGVQFFCDMVCPPGVHVPGAKSVVSSSAILISYPYVYHWTFPSNTPAQEQECCLPFDHALVCDAITSMSARSGLALTPRNLQRHDSLTGQAGAPRKEPSMANTKTAALQVAAPQQILGWRDLPRNGKQWMKMMKKGKCLNCDSKAGLDVAFANPDACEKDWATYTWGFLPDGSWEEIVSKCKNDSAYDACF